VLEKMASVRSPRAIDLERPAQRFVGPADEEIRADEEVAQILCIGPLLDLPLESGDNPIAQGVGPDKRLDLVEDPRVREEFVRWISRQTSNAFSGSMASR